MIEIPTVPVAVLTLLAFFGPYAVAIINRPWWPAKYKRLVAIIVAVALAALVLAIYFAATGEIPADWWTFFLLAVVVISASYTLVTHDSAKVLEARTAPHAPDA